MARYVDTHRLFKYGEPWAICRAALEKRGNLSTRELALELIRAKAVDTADKVLAKGITSQLIHTLRMRWKTGPLVKTGRTQAAAI
jgi:hypothetical protein